MSSIVLPLSTNELVRGARRRWLVTGGAGFIGSHLIECLLQMDQEVVCLDNFSTGSRENLNEILKSVGEQAWSNFTLVEGDIRQPDDGAQACAGVDIVLHHAALGSVPLSIEQPELCHNVNAVGSENIFQAAAKVGAGRVVYASSSAVYGDEQAVPAIESRIGNPLSPYATSKHANEIAAEQLATRKMAIVGLRYFNVVGPRQDPNGAYAAVIPRWISEFMGGVQPQVFGDGETTRDFCPVANVVQANLSAALCTLPDGENAPVFNIAMGNAISLNELFVILRDQIAAQGRCSKELQPVYGAERDGDVRHSCAAISSAETTISYQPCQTLEQGLSDTVNYYLSL